MSSSLSIILVNTQMAENIGAAARAMMNFGLQHLRLVAPRDGWPNQRAYDLAGHAAPILDNARVFDNVANVVADCQYVYAATARAREMVKPVYTPAEAMETIMQHDQPSNVGILFGPERTGLANDDVAIADAIITIPTSPSLASLNIGQSVVVLAYEWYQAAQEFGGARRSSSRRPRGDESAERRRGSVPLKNKATTSHAASPIGEKRPIATKQELQGLLDRLERELDAVDFWKVYEKKSKMWLNLRNIFTRADLTEQEVRTLHGVFAELVKGRGRKTSDQ